MAPNRFMKAKVFDDAWYKALIFHVQTKMENGKFLLFFEWKKPSLECVQNFQYLLPWQYTILMCFKRIEIANGAESRCRCWIALKMYQTINDHRDDGFSNRFSRLSSEKSTKLSKCKPRGRNDVSASLSASRFAEDSRRRFHRGVRVSDTAAAPQ